MQTGADEQYQKGMSLKVVLHDSILKDSKNTTWIKAFDAKVLVYDRDDVTLKHTISLTLRQTVNAQYYCSFLEIFDRRGGGLLELQSALQSIVLSGSKHRRFRFNSQDECATAWNSLCNSSGNSADRSINRTYFLNGITSCVSSATYIR
ncbi:hypothetical protein Trydic_g11448 [Trypoxylus dichotomus]